MSRFISGAHRNSLRKKGNNAKPAELAGHLFQDFPSPGDRTFFHTPTRPASTNASHAYTAFMKFLALSTLFFAFPALAANWPAWRGPDGTGITTETNLPLTW